MVFKPVPPPTLLSGGICQWCGPSCTAADWGICCLSTWCLPCVFGWTHMHGLGLPSGEAIALGCLFFLVCWLLGGFTMGLAGAALGFYYRSQLRARLGLPGDDCSDFFLWWCCSPCVACQEARTMLHAPVHGGVWGVAAPPLAVDLVPPQQQAMGGGLPQTQAPTPQGRGDDRV